MNEKQEQFEKLASVISQIMEKEEILTETEARLTEHFQQSKQFFDKVGKKYIAPSREQPKVARKVAAELSNRQMLSVRKFKFLKSPNPK